MWIETIIMPREEPGPRPTSPSRDRRAVLKAAGEESQALRGLVLGFLDDHHLLDAVRWISEPGYFPLVTLHCTERALEKLREAAEFVVGCAAPVDAYAPLVPAEADLSEPAPIALPMMARHY